jgi:23S rRNA (guanosine2251-2'-O)-methyltransferase
MLGLLGTGIRLASLKESLEKAEKRGLPRPAPVKVERAEIDALLPRGTVHQGIILEVEPLHEMTLDDLLGLEDSPDLVVILDQVTDPHNVGAVLRSAAAFGADAVIVTERNAPGATGILAKTASGAVEHVPLISVVNLSRALEVLKAESFWCVGLAEEGERDLSESSLSSGRIALLMGAEGEGLRRLTRERCDELARLPTSGPIGSLNVSIAAAVALYEIVRQRT